MFTLEQNYPNPFNPTTKIKFRIADAGFVSLKVNEIRSPGEYVVNWDAGNAAREFASGVYLYRLEAGNLSGLAKPFLEVRKMLLIK